MGLDEAVQVRSVKDLPASITTLLECPDPPSNPPCPKYSSVGLSSENELPITLSAQDYAWLLARTLSREMFTDGERENQEWEPGESKVPIWSAYNSLISEEMPVTRVGAPPLIAAPAHEWSTLLTVFKQAQGISIQVGLWSSTLIL